MPQDPNGEWLHPSGGLVFAIPQVGQPLFVQTSDGVVANCGQVVVCELWEEDPGGHGPFFQVKTTVFPEGFVVYPATGVYVPELVGSGKHTVPIA